MIIIFYLWGCQYALLDLLSPCVMFSSPSLFFFGLLCYRLSLAVWRSLMVCLNFENWILKRVCFVRWGDWAFLSRFPMSFPWGLSPWAGNILWRKLPVSLVRSWLSGDSVGKIAGESQRLGCPDSCHLPGLWRSLPAQRPFNLLLYRISFRLPAAVGEGQSHDHVEVWIFKHILSF